MVPAKLTPRRVLWLAGACLLLLPAFAAAESGPGRHDDPKASHAGFHGHLASTAAARPSRRIVDDNDNDAESDDLIGDSWLAPCALPQSGAAHFLLCGSPEEPQPYRSPAIRSFTAIDPFAPRPPPARFQL